MVLRTIGKAIREITMPLSMGAYGYSTATYLMGRSLHLTLIAAGVGTGSYVISRGIDTLLNHPATKTVEQKLAIKSEKVKAKIQAMQHPMTKAEKKAQKASAKANAIAKKFQEKKLKLEAGIKAIQEAVGVTDDATVSAEQPQTATTAPLPAPHSDE